MSKCNECPSADICKEREGCRIEEASWMAETASETNKGCVLAAILIIALSITAYILW